jgi:hypothetical protein
MARFTLNDNSVTVNWNWNGFSLVIENKLEDDEILFLS